MFTRIKSKLQAFTTIFSNTKHAFFEKLAQFGKGSHNNSIEDLERLLFEADLGAETVQTFLHRFRKRCRDVENIEGEKVLEELRSFAEGLLQPSTVPILIREHPHVIITVGMNGSGKTTSCAKLAYHFSQRGLSVLLVAADTFRAAAVSQLSLWSEQLQIPIVKGQMGGDPAAVLYDGLSRAKTKNFDVVIVDTAGRLESKRNLMQELVKMRQVAAKVVDKAPHETLLVLDASMGQHAVEHAKAFHAAIPLTGLMVTKIEGSAKGGVIINLYHQMGIPVQYLGIGEQVSDCIEFDPKDYINTLFPAVQSR